MLCILQMAGRSLEAELQTWKMHSQMFVNLATKIVSGKAAHEAHLQQHVEKAKASLIGYVVHHLLGCC